jgi:alanine racemase
MARPLYAQINLAAMRANVARVREKAPGTQILAVVKANAYGHGLARVLPALEDADGLALVELDAAVGLREQRYMRRILSSRVFSLKPSWRRSPGAVWRSSCTMSSR